MAEEHVDLPRGFQYGLPDQDSLEERIARAEHDAGMEINRLGRQSHCWLCRRADNNGEGENAERRRKRRLPLHRTEAGWPNCATCDGGGCFDCTDPA